jgi:signal transduction histidine kinase/ligand-binding sensor domain-containing protein
MIRTIPKYLSLVLFALKLANYGFSFPFEQLVYERKNGFEQSFVYTMVQDHENILWIGTPDGLYRYDGIAFKKYTREQGLAENIVSCSFADTKGNLYFGHIQGSITRMTTNGFEVLKLDGDKHPQVVSFLEHEGRVFALTRNHGIYLINRYTTTAFLQNEFADRVCTGMAVLDDQLYISHNEGVSHVYLKELFKQIDGASEICQFENIAVTAIVRQKHGDGLWIATEGDGVYVMDRHLKVELIVPAKDIYSQTGIFYEDDRGLWLGAKNDGIQKYEFDLEYEKYIVRGSVNIGAGFASNQISCIIQDHEFNYWIGSYDKGLVYLKAMPIETYEFNDFGFSEINAVVPWHSNQFLIGTNRGLYRLKHDPFKNKWLEKQDDWMKEFPFTITALHVSDKGIYIGAIDKGVYFIDEQRVYREIENNDFLMNSRIRKIVEDTLGNIWVSASGSGIFMINEQSKEIANYSTRSGFIHNEVNDLFLDSHNKLWIGMHANGLSVLDESGQFVHLTKNGYLPARDINSIREDKLGNIWVATDGMGLHKLDHKLQPVKSFTVDDNLTSNFCLFIIPDNHCIWVGYYDGVDRIYYEDNRVENYYSGSRNEFMPQSNTSAINAAGKALIPSPGGFHILDQNLKTQSEKKKKLILTSWRVNDMEICFATYHKKDKLQLSGNNNRLNFDFLAVSFEYPSKMLYSWRLGEKDGEWSAPSNQRSVAFSNMSPGNYHFEVKSFSDHDPNEFESFSVKFMIAPPFYQETWFITLCTLSLVAFTLLYHRQKTKRIIQQKDQFEKLVIERTREINIQKEEIIRKNEALSTAQMEIVRKNELLVDMNEKLENLVEERTEKLKNAIKELEIFLYHASHDLKGPVARIKGLTYLTQIELNHAQVKSLQLMDAESRHLDFILDKLAKIHSAIAMPIEYTTIFFGEIIHKTVEKYNNSEWDQYLPIDWQFDFNEILEVTSDRDTLMYIIENLVENSIIFQNRDPNKKKTIKITASANARKFTITVEDNGIGIPENIRDKIFDMYFRGSTSSKGNGLGLYLVHKCVQKLNGKLSYDSKVMEYTRFEVTFANKSNHQRKSISAMDKTLEMAYSPTEQR